MRGRALLFSYLTLCICIETVQSIERCKGEAILKQTNGVITDHVGSGEYLDNQQCTWIVSPSDASVTAIQVQLTKLQTEFGFDYVKLFDGPDATSPPLGWFTGDELPKQPIITSGPALTVTFSSDSLITDGGFSLSYVGFNCPRGCSNHGFCSDGICTCNVGWSGDTCDESYCANDCNAPYGKCQNNQCVCMPGYYGATCNSSLCDQRTVLTHSSGTFSDHRGGGDYQNKANCSWVITPFPPVDSVHLDFTSFLLESPGDYVTIYDGTTEDVLIGRFSGFALPPSVIATSGSMLISFQSDAVGRYPGFTATYTTSNCSGHCSGHGDCIDGACDCDIGWGSNDCSQRECTNDCWGSGSCIAGVCYCNLGYSGPDCGQCNSLTCATSYCEGLVRMNTSTGVITDHIGPYDYRSNNNCSWLIGVSDIYTSVIIRFTKFDLSDDAQLIVYDGSQTDDPIVGIFLGNRIPPTLTLTRTTALLTFIAGAGPAGAGFSASYSAVTCPNHCNYHGVCYGNGICKCKPGFSGVDCRQAYCLDGCSGHGLCINNTCQCETGYYGPSCSQNHCEGTVVLTEESGYFGDHLSGSGYLPFSNCGFLIRPGFDDLISIVFTQFQTEPQSDLVSVYQGTSDAGPRIAQLSGSWLPYPILAQGPLYIKFTTGPTRQFYGFRAQYTILGVCPNQCSANAFGCVNGTCLCNNGKQGPDCLSDATLTGLTLDTSDAVNGTASPFEWKYYKIPVSESVGSINISISYISGNPEAYLQYGNFPTRSNYIAKSIYYINPNLFFEIPSVGDYYLAIYGSDTRMDSEYGLKVTTNCPKSCGNGICVGSSCKCNDCWTGPYCTMKDTSCKDATMIAAIVVACVVFVAAVVVGGLLVYLRKRETQKPMSKDAPNAELVRSTRDSTSSDEAINMAEMPPGSTSIHTESV